jgi:hypothetical protein
VREDDGVAVSFVDIGHLLPVDIAILQLPVRFYAEHEAPPSKPDLSGTDTV